MKVHNGFELFDPRALEATPNNKLKVEKSMSIRDLYSFVANNVVGSLAIRKLNVLVLP
jgi:hypothetical protein